MRVRQVALARPRLPPPSLRMRKFGRLRTGSRLGTLGTVMLWWLCSGRRTFDSRGAGADGRGGSQRGRFVGVRPGVASAYGTEGMEGWVGERECRLWVSSERVCRRGDWGAWLRSHAAESPSRLGMVGRSWMGGEFIGGD
ncbi:hypothetical protein Tdes44962_MAKER05753 [Teratosphaeria destructans]|uniref:Uncharacterized protein n=1 Tax=Teratosphaeria destructans TaxID=418781 RepID=A0A9W7SJE8_9PEZI|nr:hypothetical protein Tdes44962_MAKER05753 [Teratosphaeria destructans]